MSKNRKKSAEGESLRPGTGGVRLGLTVFVSGALCMVLEMTGARLLAPYAGTSATVWTSVVGMTLAFLSLGNWLGGRLADRRRDALFLSLALAGAGTLLPAFFGHAMCGAVAGMSGNIYVAAAGCGILVFAFPATFFGMVLPCATKLRLERDGGTGETVGRIYALSTAGSILGTFLGGFVLISFFGSSAILRCAGFVMLALAAWTRFGKPLIPAAAAACAALFLVFGDRESVIAGQLLVETPYNSIRIIEKTDPRAGKIRMMSTSPGPGVHSAVVLDDPAGLYLPYSRLYALSSAIRPNSDRILMLGGGGYSVPKWLLSEKSGLNGEPGLIRVVELDPDMTAAARKWFELKDDPRLDIIHGDARIFLNGNREKYDLVLVDVANSHGSMPFHMATEEAFGKLRAAVAENGVLMMNLVSAVEGEKGRLFRSIWPNFRKSFRNAEIFMVNDPGHPEKIQNLMLVGSDGSLSPAGTGKRLAAERAEIRGMLERRYRGSVKEDVPPLTDDFAPVERYRPN